MNERSVEAPEELEEGFAAKLLRKQAEDGFQGEAVWCRDCKRMIGVGCACGLSFIEKVRSVQINKESLK